MRVNRIFFWVTGATTVCSLFLFVFGVASLSYFLTGDENVDMFTVLKLMEQLPDPRVFISDNLRVYNRLLYYFQQIDLSWRLPANNPLMLILNVALTILDTIYSFLTWLIAIILTIIIGLIFFPIYCVYFTYQTIGSLLQIIGVTVPMLPTWEPLAAIGI